MQATLPPSSVPQVVAAPCVFGQARRPKRKAKHLLDLADPRVPCCRNLFLDEITRGRRLIGPGSLTIVAGCAVMPGGSAGSISGTCVGWIYSTARNAGGLRHITAPSLVQAGGHWLCERIAAKARLSRQWQRDELHL